MVFCGAYVYGIDTMNYKFHWYDSFLVVLGIYLLVLQLYAVWPFTIDDMYISLRYAKNWLAGNGLVWNVDAPPVEGYSNFSFVGLAAVTLWLKGNPVFVLKAAGVIGLLFTCYFLYLITRFWFSQRESLLPVFGLLFYKGQIIWTVSGLETAVYQALICGTVYYCFRGMGYKLYPEPQEKPHYTAFVFAGLFLVMAALTRPEAPALMALFFILLCWSRPPIGARNYWQGIFLFSFTIALLFIPYFSWRFFYFGYLFPNSVYCKGLAESSILSLDFNYLQLIWVFALFGFLAWTKTEDKRHFFLWLPSVVYLLMLADADPVVAFDNRLFLPAFALLLPLALQGMRKVILRFLPQQDTLYRLGLYCLFLGTVWLFIPKMSLAEYRYFSQNPVKGEQLRKTVLDWLKEHIAPGEEVVLADSGMIPYYSDLNFIDSYCLNNLAMGHYPANQRYEQFCHEMSLKKPAVIILTSLIERGEVIYTPADACLKAFLSKSKNSYTLRHSFSTDEYRYELFTNSITETVLAL